MVPCQFTDRVSILMKNAADNVYYVLPAMTIKYFKFRHAFHVNWDIKEFNEESVRQFLLNGSVVAPAESLLFQTDSLKKLTANFQGNRTFCFKTNPGKFGWCATCKVCRSVYYSCNAVDDIMFNQGTTSEKVVDPVSQSLTYCISSLNRPNSTQPNLSWE